MFVSGYMFGLFLEPSSGQCELYQEGM